VLSTRSHRTLAVAALAALVVACAERPAPGEDPIDTALRVFELAAERPRTAEQLGELFGEPGDERRRAALGDALDALAPAGAPVVVAVVTLEAEARLAIDLRAPLAGDAEGFYSVQVERTDAERWTVRWFQGPGVTWPERAGRGDGLTTSNAPE
jgi:hypothetical protein